MFAFAQRVVPLGVGLATSYGVYVLTKMRADSDTSDLLVRLNRHHASLPVSDNLVEVRCDSFVHRGKLLIKIPGDDS